MTAYRSALPCFAAGGASPVQQMRERLMLDVPEEQLAARVQATPPSPPTPHPALP